MSVYTFPERTIGYYVCPQCEETTRSTNQLYGHSPDLEKYIAVVCCDKCLPTSVHSLYSIIWTHKSFEELITPIDIFDMGGNLVRQYTCIMDYMDEHSREYTFDPGTIRRVMEYKKNLKMEKLLGSPVNVKTKVKALGKT